MTIKQLRERTGLSQRLFAQKFNIAVSTLQSWEQERRKTPSYVLFMIEYILYLESHKSEST